MAILALLWSAWRSSAVSVRQGQAWLLITAGMAGALAGSVVDLYSNLLSVPRGVIFSVVDLGHVAYYLLFITGVLLMPREPLHRRDWLSILLDVGTMSVAGIVLLWAFLFGPTIVDDALTTPFSARTFDLLLLMVYPSFSLMLFWTALMVLLRRPLAVSNLAVGLLVASIAFTVLGDLIFDVQSLIMGLTPTAAAEASYLVSCLVLCLAAIAHGDSIASVAAPNAAPAGPTSARLASLVRPARAGTGVQRRVASRWWTRYLPLAWSIFAYLVLAWSGYYATGITAPLQFIASVLGVSVLFGLVLMRQLAVVNENSLLAEQLREELAERKIAEQLLQLNQERMKFLLSATPAVIYTASVQGRENSRHTFVSDNARVVFGHAPSAFTTEPGFWSGHVHPDDLPEVSCQWLDIAQGEPFVHEYRFLTGEGRYCWVHDEARLIRNRAGQAAEIVGYWTDVTVRKQMERALHKANEELESRVQARTAELSRANASLLREIEERGRVEQALRESEARSRAISELISDFAFSVRVEANGTLGLDWVTGGFGRLIGPNFAVEGWDIVKWVDPRDQFAAHSIFRAAVLSRSAIPFELRVQTESGEVRWIQGSMLAGRDEASGRVNRVICAGQDITERKQAQEREESYTQDLRALSRAAMAFVESPMGADIHALIAEQLRAMIGESIVVITQYNPDTARLAIRTALGVDASVERLRAKTGFGVEGFRLAVEQADIARLTSGHLERIDQATLAHALSRSPDGTQDVLLRLFADHTIYTMGFSWNGQLFGSVVIILPKDRELSNPRLVETFVGQAAVTLQRWQAEEQLQASLREKEVMLKEIHHRVKNNLQIVSSLLNLQVQRVQDQNTIDMLRDSQNRVRSMAFIHERLYRSPDLARVNFGEYVRAVASHLINSYQLREASAISVRVDIADDVRLGIDAAIPCGLIVNELVSNAVKHAFPPGRPGPGLISVSMQHGSGVCTLVVRDNGVGLPAGVDFRRVDSLGLQLVTILTQQLEGTIELDRQSGTAFTITFAQNP